MLFFIKSKGFKGEMITAGSNHTVSYSIFHRSKEFITTIFLFQVAIMLIVINLMELLLIFFNIVILVCSYHKL